MDPCSQTENAIMLLYNSSYLVTYILDKILLEFWSSKQITLELSARLLAGDSGVPLLN